MKSKMDINCTVQECPSKVENGKNLPQLKHSEVLFETITV